MGLATHRDDCITQPAVRRVGVHAGMPHGRDHDFGRGHGKVEALKACFGRVILWPIIFKAGARDESDEIRVTGDLHGIVKTGDNHGCLSMEAKFFQSLVNGACKFAFA